MGRGPGWTVRAAGLSDRWQARLAARARPRGPVAWPEPRIGGDPARGRQLLKGRLRIGRELVEAPGRSLWDLGIEEPEALALHGFGWLDDVLAVGDAAARAQGQAWVADWLNRFGRGTGPGWTPALSAERLVRLLGHARTLLHPPGVGQERLGRAVAAEAAFLERRWRKVPAGRARIAALAALILADIALPGRRTLAARATRELAEEAARAVDAQGAVPTRNPEELLEIMALLVGANGARAGADLPPDPGIGAAIARGAPTLRALRHADGSLARFHGGCRGPEGRLDEVLAAAGRPSLPVGKGGVPLHMGYLRLAAGRTTMVVDAAPPPTGAASVAAHASTLGFELTSGRRPLVVSMGSGRSYGERWRRAARATASHSTLSLDTASSARLGLPLPGEEGGRIVEGPARVIAEAAAQAGGVRAELAQDGWRGSHGLTHARILHLSSDGRSLEGEDLLTTLTAADGEAFDRAIDASNRLGIAFAVRFHLHPDVEAEIDARGDVAILLKSGEEWMFSHEGEGMVSI